MTQAGIRKIVTILIGLVWFINGLWCKVLGKVPRHEEIVERILGGTYSTELTVLIGLSEIGMAVWVWSTLFRRINAALQIALVLTMNLLETFLANDLLLWGPLNLVWAFLFSLIVFFWGFGRKSSRQSL